MTWALRPWRPHSWKKKGGSLSTTNTRTLVLTHAKKAEKPQKHATPRVNVCVQSGPRRFPHEEFRQVGCLIYLPFTGCGPNAAQLDPWFRALLWPDCTSGVFLPEPQSTAIPPTYDPQNPREWEEDRWRSRLPGHRDHSGVHHGGTDGLIRVELGFPRCGSVCLLVLLLSLSWLPALYRRHTCVPLIENFKGVICPLVLIFSIAWQPFWQVKIVTPRKALAQYVPLQVVLLPVLWNRLSCVHPAKAAGAPCWVRRH